MDKLHGEAQNADDGHRSVKASNGLDEILRRKHFLLLWLKKKYAALKQVVEENGMWYGAVSIPDSAGTNEAKQNMDVCHNETRGNSEPQNLTSQLN